MIVGKDFWCPECRSVVRSALVGRPVHFSWASCLCFDCDPLIRSIVETVFILLLVMYLYWKQVYDNFEVFDATSSPSGFFLAISQFLAHYQSLQQSLLNRATNAPGKRREVLGANVLLYYDSWLNSSLVCIIILIVEFFSTNMVLGLLVLDLACWTLWCCCNSDRRRDDDDELMCCALSFLILMLGCTSWATYEFANDRLDVTVNALGREG